MYIYIYIYAYIYICVFVCVDGTGRDNCSADGVSKSVVCEIFQEIKRIDEMMTHTKESITKTCTLTGRGCKDISE